MIKPLDIVQTPKGGIAMVTECSPAQPNLPLNRYSLDYILNPKHEHNAWWFEKDLKKLASIPVLIGRAMCHPFGNNAVMVEQIMNS